MHWWPLLLYMGECSGWFCVSFGIRFAVVDDMEFGVIWDVCSWPFWCLLRLVVALAGHSTRLRDGDDGCCEEGYVEEKGIFV